MTRPKKDFEKGCLVIVSLGIETDETPLMLDFVYVNRFTTTIVDADGPVCTEPKTKWKREYHNRHTVMWEGQGHGTYGNVFVSIRTDTHPREI